MRLKIICLALTCLCVAQASEITATLTAQEIITSVEDRNIRVTLVVFSSRDFSLCIVDNAAAADSGKYARLALAMKTVGAAAGCNGGFFQRHPFTPVGLMIADGVRTGSFDPAGWMKGLVAVRNGAMRFEVAASFKDTPDVTQLVQSGPWLVRNGIAESIPGDPRLAQRTFICRDDKDRWAIGITGPCTLEELAIALTSEPVKPALAIHEALNLDGGPSTGLWVKGIDKDFSAPERWVVRNYLAIFPRKG